MGERPKRQVLRLADSAGRQEGRGGRERAGGKQGRAEELRSRNEEPWAYQQEVLDC